MLALRSQIFEYLRETFSQTCLGVAAIGSFRKNVKKTAVFLRKRLTIVERFEGLWSVGTCFRYYSIL